MFPSASVYETLPSAEAWIRTLVINPRSTPDNIICTLIPCRLDNTHICLSYTWGTQTASHQITVNDKPLFIRGNLLEFLKECHRNEALLDHPLWIDAVCINQDDIPEKNQQVAMMGQIYAQARRVIIWLGCGDSNVAEALRHMQAYADSPFVDSDVAQSQEIELADGFSTDVSKTDYSGTPLRTYWNNFDAVTNLPYWTRMWIVQEFLSAKDSEIWYGNLRTNWWILTEYFSFIETHAGPEGCDPRLGYRKTRRSSCAWLLRRLVLKDEAPSMSTILPFSITLAQLQQNCFDKRDLVYGARALDKDLQTIPVDYESHKCKLLRALFGSPATKTDYIYIGLLLIDRLALDIGETIKMTFDCLPHETWTADISNIGIVFNSTSDDKEAVCKVDWSALAYRRKMDKSIQCDDGIGSVTCDVNSKAGSMRSPDLQPGDLVFHVVMVDLLLVFRKPDQFGRLQERVTNQQHPDNYPDAEQATNLVADYKFLTCFEIKSKIADGQRPRLKSEYKNTRITHNERTVDLISELPLSCITLAPFGYRLTLTWRALLRIWELRDTGITIYKPKMAETVGSWDEEEAKAREQKDGS